jgi:hypothetical protein
MSLYRIYIDEVGNHDMQHADDPNQRFLGLTGVILNGDYVTQTLQPEMMKIKTDFFFSDPDEPVIFHRKEMINKKGPFSVLWNSNVKKKFDTELLKALECWEYKVVTVVIDKLVHREQYKVWRYQPYHYCLAVLLERYILFLERAGARGDVMVESRGAREDRRLADSYSRLYQNGTDFIDQTRFQARLTSRELKIKPKRANIPGLQLADIIAHPSRQEVLIDNKLLHDDRFTFGKRICEILRRDKYLRDPRTGDISGYGKKLLP